MPTHYFLGNALLGSTPATPQWDDTTLMHSSQVFVCPVCGEAWGRIALESAKEWYPVRRGCHRHPWIEDVGGTFIAPWRQHLHDLPGEVLRYELNLRLKEYPDA